MKRRATGNGNLVKATEKLRQLGVKPKKQLPNQLLERANVEEIDFANDESVTEND